MSLIIQFSELGCLWVSSSSACQLKLFKHPAPNPVTRLLLILWALLQIFKYTVNLDLLLKI